MTDNIIPINPKQRPFDLHEPDPETVDMLEEFLQKARAGEIIGCVLIASTPTLETWERHTGHSDMLRTIGVLEVAKTRYAQMVLDDEAEETDPNITA
jgi:hypothetical protein